MMKKFNSLLFIVSAILLLAACSSDKEKESSTKDEPNKGKDVSSEETFTLKYNSAFPPSTQDWHAKYKATEEFAKLVEEKSDGRLKIDVFYSNQLAGQSESLDALAKGTIDIQNLTPSAWGDKVPEGDVTGLAYWNINEEHSLYIMRDTDIGELYEEAMGEYGVQVLSYWPAGAAGFLSTKPIASVSDLKGLTMNLHSSLAADMYAKAGAGVATIPVAELYEAFLRGTLNGVSFPFYALEDYKFAEVVDYITLPATISPVLGLVAISQKTMDKLPEDLQKILIETGLEMENAAIEGSKRLTEHGYKYAEENGVEIINMTKEAYEEMLKLNKETSWKKFAEKNERTRRMVELMEIETEKWKEENPEMAKEFENSFAK